MTSQNSSLINDLKARYPTVNGSPRWEYLLLFIIPFGTIWGNVFVCLAVYLERRLRHRFNLFLVSLAISDLLCAILVMPVSAWHMIAGRSDRDLALCLIWYSLDIFFTATTIIHLCNISLDRYLALRRPFGSVRTRPHPLNSLSLRIILSWLISFSIAGPLFIFALKQQEQEIEIKTTPSSDITRLIYYNSVNNSSGEPIDPTASYKGCGPNDPSFVLTAIGVTFVLPLIIMITTYVLTVQTLKRHMKQIQAIELYATKRANHRSTTVGRQTSTIKNKEQSYVTGNSVNISEIMAETAPYINPNATIKSDSRKCKSGNGIWRKPINRSIDELNGETQIMSLNKMETLDMMIQNTATTTTTTSSSTSIITAAATTTTITTTATNGTASNESKKEHSDDNNNNNDDKDTNRPSNDRESTNSSEMSYPTQISRTKNSRTKHKESGKSKLDSEEPPNHQESIYVRTNLGSRPKESVRKPIGTSFSWGFRSTHNSVANTFSNINNSNNTNPTNSGTTQSDNRLTIDRIHKGKRAVRVIGVLFGVFITCYLPFFIVYIIDVLCPSCNPWTGPIMAHLEWLGYLSSMLNPFVYHSFNPTFRRTFRRMMRCACFRKHRRHEYYAIWRRRIRL